MNAIENGYMQDEIAKSAYTCQRQIESGEKVIVGLNKFSMKEDQQIPVFKVDDNIQKIQVEKLTRFKLNRDSVRSAEALRNINDKAVAGENIMPAVLEAVEKKCTLGEIADVLRNVYGEYR